MATIWSCKIGALEPAPLRGGADLPMRRAVERAFEEVAGLVPAFNFSGWGAQLTETELAVVENRRPSEADYRAELIRDAAPELYEAACLALDLIECLQEEEGHSPSTAIPAHALRAALSSARGNQS